MFISKQITHSTLLINCILIFCLCHTAHAKSVYVITDRSSTVKAYDIQDDQIQYQANAENLQGHGGGAVGLALDPDTQILFVTYESSNIIEMVNAKTMISEENPVTVPGADSLAGIAFDQGKQKLYVVQRENNRLFVYLWNPVTKTLTLEGGAYKTLDNLGGLGAFGIALDENKERLYVSNATSTVHYYDTNSWNDVNSVYVNRVAVGIAIDSTNHYMYTGAFTGSTGQHSFLVRTDINDVNSPTFTEKPIGAYVIGITTDPSTGLIYITTSNYRIEVHDTNNFAALPYDTETTESGPADIVLAGDVSYKPPFPLVELVKDDNDVDCASPLISDVEYEFMGSPYNWLYYTIDCNANGHADTNVFITDYLPVEVDYNSSDPCGFYDPNRHTVTWYIGDMSASFSNTFRIQVAVNYYAKPGHKIINLCGIENDEYYTFAIEDTNICCYGGDIIYVNQDANDSNSYNNGTSWFDAYTDLQDALHTARNCDCDQIWAAEGTYKPTNRSETSARSIFFELVNNIAIYGGFPNSGDPNFSDRNWQTRITTLSGDIGTPNEKNDNSYHVVKCEDINNAVLDGFTITAGNANAIYPDPNYFGGGIYCKDSNNITIRNCVITQNEASTGSSYGGGIYFKDSNNLTLTDCNVSDNAASHGGGLHNESSSANLINCIFSDNTSDYGGCGMRNYRSSPTLINCIFNSNTTLTQYNNGGGMYNDQSSPTLINCTFCGNSLYTWGEGGAIFNTNSSEPNVTNCIFSNNSAWNGGAVYNDYSDPNITNCIFSGNKTSFDGGGIYNYQSSGTVTNCIFSGNTSKNGGGMENWQSSPTLTNCTFSGNLANYGGGMYNGDNSVPNVTNCIFTGNTATSEYGGGMYNYGSSPTVTNCIFSGNVSTYLDGGGGGMFNYQSSPTLINCTFSRNSAGSDGGGIYNYDIDSSPNVTNCIFWDNTPAEIEDGSPVITYSDIQGGWEDTGNINKDPCFFEVDAPTGSWSEDAFYDSSTFQSTLTDSGADWAVNQLAGKFVNPDTDQYLQFFIVSNDVSTINVWSDVRSIAEEGDTYHIYDYHLRVDSPCIDRGYPDGDYTGQTDIDGEPRVFDGDYNDVPIVDMGADEYYWSLADFNTDGFVNFFDYAFFADAWLTIPTDQYYNEICDLVDNDCIDSNDLARFCEDWLWQTAWAKAFPCAYDEGLGRSMGMGMGESLALAEGLDSSKYAQPEITAADIEQIIKWLADLWLTNEEVRKMITEDEWLKFIEAVIEAAKELI